MKETTLKERFEETLKQAWYISEKGRTEVPPIVSERFLSFIQAELLLLAEEVEKSKRPRNKNLNDTLIIRLNAHNTAVDETTDLIRSKAADLN